MADNPELHPFAQAQIDAWRALASERVDENTAHTVNLLEQFERDIGPLVAPHAQAVLDNPSLPAEWRPLLEQLANPEHFGTSLIIGFVLGGLLGPLFGAVFGPVNQGIANDAWRVAVASPPPGGLRPLTPDLLAAMALKGVSTSGNTPPIPGGLIPEAALSGISGERLAAMIEAAGQSIGIAEALLLERRQQFVGVTLLDVLRYSNVNPKFYDSIANLKYIPLSVGEVVTANLKGHLDDATAVTLLQHAGIDGAADAGNGTTVQQLLKHSAGRPFTPHEVYQAIHRGYGGPITPEDALRQGDINDDYAPMLPFLQYNYPPLFQLLRLLTAGTITPVRAAQILKFEGYEQQDIDAIISTHASGASGKVKELTESQIVASYENRLMDRPTALARLEALNYSAADANSLLDLADERRKTALMNATVSMVGRRYVAYKIGKQPAVDYLTDAGIPNTAQLDLFRLWDIERLANVHVPTPASIVGAGRRGIITPAEVKVRLTQAGIDPGDMAIMVGDGWPPTHGAEAIAAAQAVIRGDTSWPTGGTTGGPAPKRLTVTQIGNLYSAGTIGKAEAVADLETLGYTTTQANELVTTFSAPPKPGP